MFNFLQIISMFFTATPEHEIFVAPDIEQVNLLFHTSVADFNKGVIDSRYHLHLSDSGIFNNTATRIFVYKNLKETIISFEGTGSENNEYNINALRMNEITKLGLIPPSYEQALTYTKEYIKKHPQEHNIWLSGISAGGSQAQYVAQHTGLPGMSFAGPGIPLNLPYKTPKNFWCYVNKYDPVGGFSNDTSFNLDSIQISHYGQTITLNGFKRSGTIYNIFYSAIKYKGNFLYYHMPTEYEKALNVKYGNIIYIDNL